MSTRVGAILFVSETEIGLLGYGEYEGDFLLSPEAVGDVCEYVRGQSNKNPKIKLDNGQVVWGCECWWGPEEKVKYAIVESGKKITPVDIAKVRESFYHELN